MRLTISDFGQVQGLDWSQTWTEPPELVLLSPPDQWSSLGFVIILPEPYHCNTRVWAVYIFSSHLYMSELTTTVH